MPAFTAVHAKTTSQSGLTLCVIPCICYPAIEPILSLGFNFHLSASQRVIIAPESVPIDSISISGLSTIEI